MDALEEFPRRCSETDTVACVVEDLLDEVTVAIGGGFVGDGPVEAGLLLAGAVQGG